jgi:hypothetical protein
MNRVLNVLTIMEWKPIPILYHPIRIKVTYLKLRTHRKENSLSSYVESSFAWGNIFNYVFILVKERLQLLFFELNRNFVPTIESLV